MDRTADFAELYKAVPRCLAAAIVPVLARVAFFARGRRDRRATAIDAPCRERYRRLAKRVRSSSRHPAT